MYTKIVRLKLLLLSFTCLSFASKAQDRIFTYTYQSNVLNKGQRELEVWNTLRQGKQDFFSRLDNRTEFEVGLGSNLQTSFYLNLTSITQTVMDGTQKSTYTKHEIGFSNEWKLKLTDPVANPIGLALYGEYGISSSEYELEGKIIIDKKINNLTIAGNATYEGEFAPTYVNNKLKWEKEGHVDFNLAFGYAIGHGFHLTQENNFRNVYVEKELEHSALYSGLGFSYVRENFWVNFTALPQIKSFKGATDNKLNLDKFEKVQFRLLFSYAF
ncbi:MAG: hypothetical protein AAB347_07275 [Bacteroidota bacterium]